MADTGMAEDISSLLYFVNSIDSENASMTAEERETFFKELFSNMIKTGVTSDEIISLNTFCLKALDFYASDEATSLLEEVVSQDMPREPEVPDHNPPPPPPRSDNHFSWWDEEERKDKKALLLPHSINSEYTTSKEARDDILEKFRNLGKTALGESDIADKDDEENKMIGYAESWDGPTDDELKEIEEEGFLDNDEIWKYVDESVDRRQMDVELRTLDDDEFPPKEPDYAGMSNKQRKRAKRMYKNQLKAYNRDKNRRTQNVLFGKNRNSSKYGMDSFELERNRTSFVHVNKPICYDFDTRDLEENQEQDIGKLTSYFREKKDQKIFLGNPKFNSAPNSVPFNSLPNDDKLRVAFGLSPERFDSFKNNQTLPDDFISRGLD
jgi:hypothetical protein